MFGYVKPAHAELLVREYDFYRATYCGLCRAMKRHTGFFSSFSLSYDFVFLALCRMLLHKGETPCRHCRCIAHPLKKRACLQENEALLYAARSAAILMREKLRDDMRDRGAGKKMRAWAAYPVFARAGRRAEREGLSPLSEKIGSFLVALGALEKDRVASIDRPAEQFGLLLGEVFSEGIAPEFHEIYHRVGFHLGRFIYAADAAEDFRKDLKSGDYNPYVLLYGKDGFGAQARQAAKTALLLELQALGGAVSQLPFGNALAVEHIIKNTVYLGLPARIHFLDEPKTPATEQKGNMA